MESLKKDLIKLIDENRDSFYNKFGRVQWEQVVPALATYIEGRERKAKENLIWVMIQDWQDAQSINEDLDKEQFSFNDIEHDLYEYLPKSTLTDQPGEKA